MKKIFVFLFIFCLSIPVVAQKQYFGAATKITMTDDTETKEVKKEVLFQLKDDEDNSYFLTIIDNNVFHQSAEVIDRKIINKDTIYYDVVLDDASEIELFIDLKKDIIVRVILYYGDLTFTYE